MRELQVGLITEAVRRLCIESSCILKPDLLLALENARDREESPLGKELLRQLLENAEIAKQNLLPLCQDTGMAVIFADIGQDVHFTGGSLEDAINEGVRAGYRDGCLRKSVLDGPFTRRNTGDNTPAIIHYRIVPGDRVHLSMMPKGFGGENMSRIYMLKPSDGIEGVKRVILEAVEQADGFPCPPTVIGVGIGGDFEKAALSAKHALLRPVGEPSPDPFAADLEKELLESINRLGIGPQGLGGRFTSFAIHIETYPTHIAALPVAVNISCNSTRRAECEI